MFTLLTALIILAAPLSGALKAVAILALSAFAFRPWNARQLALFISSSIIFVLSDLGAIRSGFFKFSSPDVWGLPYWEFVAWGFWIVLGYRNLPQQFPKKLDWRVAVLAIVFLQSFVLIQDRAIVLTVSATVLCVSVMMLRNRYDFIYLGFFAAVGLAVESVGLYFDLWTYPDANLMVAAVQFVVMWAGVGLYFRNIVGPFLQSKIPAR